MKPAFIFLTFCTLALQLVMQAGGADFPVSFAAVANKGLDDETAGDGLGGWTDEGPENALQAFPTGRQMFRGIPFEIPSEGNAVVALRGESWPDAPVSVTLPAGHGPAKTLFILSAHAWTDGPVELARIIVRHGNGVESVHPVVNHTHTGPWWYPSRRAASSVVWRGETRRGIPVGVYMTGYDLGEGQVEEIRIEGNSIRGQLLLLGATLSTAEASLSAPGPRWERVEEDRSAWFPLAKAPANSTSVLLPDGPAQERLKKRHLILEISPGLTVGSDAEQREVLKLAGENGYTALRTAPIDSLLGAATASQNRERLVALARAASEAKIGLSIILAGEREYQAEDGVAAFRELDPRASECVMLDPAAGHVLRRDAATLDSAFREAVNTPSALLNDTGLFSYHFDDLSRPHRRMLLNRWAAWLADRYGSAATAAEKWAVTDEAPPLLPGENPARARLDLLPMPVVLAAPERYRPRIADQMTFLDELQRGWLIEHRNFAGGLFPRAAWSSTAWLPPAWLRGLETNLSACLDNIEVKAELLMTLDGVGERKVPFHITHPPLSTEGLAPLSSPFQRVDGRGFLIEDATGRWPGDRDFLRVLRTIILAASQGWDGIIHRTLDTPASASTLDQLKQSANAPTHALQNPSCLALLPLGRNLFLRGDIAPLPISVRAPLPAPADAVKQLPPIPKLNDPARSGLPAWLPFVAGVASATGLSAIQTELPMPEPAADGFVTSATGETAINPSLAIMRVQTPASTALLGELGGGAALPVNFPIQSASGCGVAFATTLDGLPLQNSRKILLGLVGRSANTGTVEESSTAPVGLHPRVWRLQNPGTAPVVMSPVSAEFQLHPAVGQRSTLQPLDFAGRPIGDPSEQPRESDSSLRLRLNNSAHHTPLYLLTHED